MFPSEHETRHTTYQHPKGGITPLRYDLALQECMRKQHDRRQITANVPATFKLNLLMRWLFNWTESLSSTSKHAANQRAK